MQNLTKSSKTRKDLKVALGFFIGILFLGLLILTDSRYGDHNGNTTLALMIITIIGGLGTLILTITLAITDHQKENRTPKESQS